MGSQGALHSLLTVTGWPLLPRGKQGPGSGPWHQYYSTQHLPQTWGSLLNSSEPQFSYLSMGGAVTLVGCHEDEDEAVRTRSVTGAQDT